MRLSSLGLVIAALAATGCQEVPSYAVRWNIAPRVGTEQPPTPQPQDEEMTNPAVCTRSGVSQVQVWVVDEDRPADFFIETVVDDFTRPCFPERFRRPGGAVRGATLQPGDYTVFAVATRATGAPWGQCPDELPEDDGPFLDDTDGGTTGGDEATDGDAETGGDSRRSICTGSNVRGYFEAAHLLDLELCVDGACNPELGLTSCDCQTFTVTPGTIERLPDFVIDAPPECEDGVDNDEDGLVDQLDPGCQQGESEGNPVLSPEIALDLSLLSGNPNAACRNIGVGLLALTIDGEDISPIQCETGTRRFTTPLSVGPHELTVTGVTGGLEPITVTKSVRFEVTERGVTDPEVLTIGFDDVDLLEPLETSIRFTYELNAPGERGAPGEPDDNLIGDPVLCSDPSVLATDFRLRLLDLGGEPVTPSPLTSAGFRLDGSSTPCSPAIITTADVFRWGGYLLELEVFNADGEVCWTNAGNPTPLVPSDALRVAVDPVDPDDMSNQQGGTDGPESIAAGCFAQ